MCKREILFVATILPILLTGFPASADSPFVVDINCEPGFRTGEVWFGLRWDGANIGVGQSVTFDAATRLQGVEFQFSISVITNNGVSPLLPGDEVSMAILSLDGEPLAITTAIIPGPIAGGINGPWIYFDFTIAGFPWAPGQYILVA